jgi:hypothetical protein
MAAFSSFHFSDSGARFQRVPVTSAGCARPHQTTDLAEIAARVRAVAGGAVLLLWTTLALGFSLLLAVDFFL